MKANTSNRIPLNGLLLSATSAAAVIFFTAGGDVHGQSWSYASVLTEASTEDDLQEATDPLTVFVEASAADGVDVASGTVLIEQGRIEADVVSVSGVGSDTGAMVTTAAVWRDAIWVDDPEALFDDFGAPRARIAVQLDVSGAIGSSGAPEATTLSYDLDLFVGTQHAETAGHETAAIDWNPALEVPTGELAALASAEGLSIQYSLNAGVWARDGAQAAAELGTAATPAVILVTDLNGAPLEGISFYTASGYEFPVNPVVGGPSADFNGDGAVDGLDLAAWRRGFGGEDGAGRALGNADGDSDVDGADFLSWQRGFGTLPQPEVAGATSVPEPGSGALAAAILAMLAWRVKARVRAL